MKKFLATLLLLTSLITNACWFEPGTINLDDLSWIGAYIAGVNNYRAHTDFPNNDFILYNNFTVPMPITVWVVVQPRRTSTHLYPVRRAVLQYKVLPFGNWVTVKEFSNITTTLDYPTPIALFGNNCINIPVPDGTELLIRLYLADQYLETGDLDTDITSAILDVISIETGTESIWYEGGWSAPYVIKVRVDGKRPGR